MIRKILSVILVLSLAFCMLPMGILTAFAEENTHSVSLCFGDIYSPIGMLIAEHGKPVERPEDPAPENMIFLGWYLNGEELYDFSTPVTEDIVLVALFESETTLYYGDVNEDGEMDATDALAVLQISVGKIGCTDTQKTVADVNCNGKVDAPDALLILQYTVGKITVFPVEQ